MLELKMLLMHIVMEYRSELEAHGMKEKSIFV